MGSHYQFVYAQFSKLPWKRAQREFWRKRGTERQIPTAVGIEIDRSTGKSSRCYISVRTLRTAGKNTGEKRGRKITTQNRKRKNWRQPRGVREARGQHGPSGTTQTSRSPLIFDLSFYAVPPHGTTADRQIAALNFRALWSAYLTLSTINNREERSREGSYEQASLSWYQIPIKSFNFPLQIGKKTQIIFLSLIRR